MPKRKTPEPSEAAAEAFNRHLARHTDDPGELELQLRTTLELHKAALLEAIPELSAENIIEYTAAVAAAIAAEAITPDIGRALLYAAQLALAARGGNHAR